MYLKYRIEIPTYFPLSHISVPYVYGLAQEDYRP